MRCRQPLSAVLVRTYGDVAVDPDAGFEIRTDPGLKRSELELAGAPACAGRRQKVVVFPKPEIEIAVRIEPPDGLAEKAFQAPEKIINLGKFLPGVREEIFELQF